MIENGGSMMGSYAGLGKHGAIGVMLALVALNAAALWLVYSLSTSYIREATATMSQLTIAVSELSTLVKLPNRISARTGVSPSPESGT